MITVVTLAIVVPSLLIFTFLGLRRVTSTPIFGSLAHARGGDQRGIALQTIIVMVVLLAIAGAVATVLLNRAGSESDRLENEDVDLTEFTTRFGCDTEGGTWTDGTDQNGDGDTDDVGEGTCA